MDRPARTVPEFCIAYGISRATFYNLAKAGKGPRVMKIGKLTRISAEAETEWCRTMEQDAEAPRAA